MKNNYFPMQCARLSLTQQPYLTICMAKLLYLCNKTHALTYTCMRNFNFLFIKEAKLRKANEDRLLISPSSEISRCLIAIVMTKHVFLFIRLYIRRLKNKVSLPVNRFL